MHDAIMGPASDLRCEGELVAFFEEHLRPYHDDCPYTSGSCVMLPDYGGEFDQQLQSDALFNLDMQPFWSSIGEETNMHESAIPSTIDVAAEGAKAEVVNGAESSPSCEGDNTNDSRVVTSKRRAQNRSAQRSLRQRKLQHVRDLETGIILHHDKQSLLHSNNELLKLQLDNLKIENQVLHATIRPPPVSVDGPIPVRTSRGSRSSMSEVSSSTATNFNTPMASSCCSSPESEFTASAQEARVPIPRRAHKKSKTGCRTCKQRKVKVDYDAG
ncbi:AP-1-like transcription factor [Elasticomyces elasticus]|nr:AP-1-like transcription factor [Elasticomyces elasticus]